MHVYLAYRLFYSKHFIIYPKKVNEILSKHPYYIWNILYFVIMLYYRAYNLHINTLLIQKPFYFNIFQLISLNVVWKKAKISHVFMFRLLM